MTVPAVALRGCLVGIGSGICVGLGSVVGVVDARIQAWVGSLLLLCVYLGCNSFDLLSEGLDSAEHRLALVALGVGLKSCGNIEKVSY